MTPCIGVTINGIIHKKFYELLAFDRRLCYSLTMKTKRSILRILRQEKARLKDQFKIKRLWTFGSRMKGKAHFSSDLDVLVDFEKGADLIHLVGLSLFLGKKMHCKVDVVSRKALRRELKSSILKEAYPI